MWININLHNQSILWKISGALIIFTIKLIAILAPCDSELYYHWVLLTLFYSIIIIAFPFEIKWHLSSCFCWWFIIILNLFFGLSSTLMSVIFIVVLKIFIIILTYNIMFRLISMIWVWDLPTMRFKIFKILSCSTFASTVSHIPNYLFLKIYYIFYNYNYI